MSTRKTSDSNTKTTFANHKKKKPERMIKPKFRSLKEFLKSFNASEMQDKLVKRRNSYFIVDDRLKEKLDSMSPDFVSAFFSIGLFAGYEKKGQFYPSLELIKNVSKDYPHKVSLDKRSSWLFLCGRDIFKESVDSTIYQGYVIIENEKNEFLGLGYGNKNMILNIIDLGDFLRRENKKKSK